MRKMFFSETKYLLILKIKKDEKFKKFEFS